MKTVAFSLAIYTLVATSLADSGTFKWYNAANGIGIVTADVRGPEIFFVFI